ncbi:MAG: insulinase family protein [Polyangiales bacterium]
MTRAALRAPLLCAALLGGVPDAAVRTRGEGATRAETVVLANGLRVIVATAPEARDVALTLLHTRAGPGAAWPVPDAAAATEELLRQAIANARTSGGVPDVDPGTLFHSLRNGGYVTFRARVHRRRWAPLLWHHAWALRHFEASREALATWAATHEPAAVTAEEVERFFHARYGPSSCALVVVGPLTMADVLPYAARLLEPWSGEGRLDLPSAAPAPPSRPAPAEGRLRLLEATAREEVRVRWELTLHARGAREEAVVRVLYAALGGQGASSFKRVLRRDRGDLYDFDERALTHDGEAWTLRFGADFPADRVAPSLRAMRDVLDALSSRGLPQEDLDVGRGLCDAGWRRDVDSVEGLADAIAANVAAGWSPPDAPPPWLAVLASLRREEVDAFVRRERAAERARVSLDGDPSAFRGGALDEAGFGPLRVTPAVEHDAR